jgi:hypothetical protein
VYEYLASRAPIFALVHKGTPEWRLLSESGHAYIAELDNPVEIRSTFERLISEFREGKLSISPNEHLLQRFSRRSVAERLAAIIKDVATYREPVAQR